VSPYRRRVKRKSQENAHSSAKDTTARKLFHDKIWERRRPKPKNPENAQRAEGGLASKLTSTESMPHFEEEG